MPEAEDRFIEALLEEHNRLGTGDDKALLALIRARTEEQPESGHGAAQRIKLGFQQWMEIAAAVALIALALTAAFRHFSPGSASPVLPNSVIATHQADENTGAKSGKNQRPLRIKIGTTAPHTDPTLPPIEGISVRPPVEFDPSDHSPFAMSWQSPIQAPLSTLSTAPAASDGSLTLDEIQSLLTHGAPMPSGALSASGLLSHLPLMEASAAEIPAIRVSAAACPWNGEHLLAHVVAFGNSASLASLQGLRSDAEFTTTPDLVIEFNPAQVAGYRLIAQAVRNGGQFSAVYEIITTDRPTATPAPGSPELKYQPANASQELVSVRIGSLEHPIARSETTLWRKSSADLRLSTAAVWFVGLVDSGTAADDAARKQILEILDAAPAEFPQYTQLRSVVADWPRN
jgi:hypothetical protein